MYFESHAHYDDERFDEDREILLKSLKDNGVDYVINVSADMEGGRKGLELAEKYPFVYCSLGVHPHEVEHLTDKDLEEIKELASHPKVVAIGEIGLDYYYNYSPKDVQRHWFKEQLKLAHELNLPVIIHSRDACAETYDIIMDSPVRNGVIHCFSSSYEVGKNYVENGFYLGIGGSLTFKNAKKAIEVVEKIDLKHILLETDAPYLTPVPHRGKRNDSTYLKYVAEKIAELKGITVEEVASITSENAKKLFGISLK